MATNHPTQSHRSLRRDEEGNLRISIVGNSGVGKSTVAKKLSSILQLPVIHLDAVYFKPKWVPTPDDEFCHMVQNFMSENHSWIIDGDYEQVSDLVKQSATCILWLDPPFMLYFPRLILRTFFQLIGMISPCSPGCNDNFVDLIFWEGNSVLLWSWTHHTPLKITYTSAMQVPGDDQGGKWLRLSGWVRELNAWLEEVESSAKAQ